MRVIDEGKSPIGLGYDWWRVPPVVRLKAADWAAAVLQPPVDESEVEGVTAGVDAAAAPPPPQLDRVELEQFIQLMQGYTVCIWGECFLINDRRRQQKLADEEMERARNPAWYTRAWNAISGGGAAVNSAAVDGAAAEAAALPATSPAATAAVAAPAVVIAEGSGADFEESPKFVGARRGYVFKLGAKGLGYYKEP